MWFSQHRNTVKTIDAFNAFRSVSLLLINANLFEFNSFKAYILNQVQIAILHSVCYLNSKIQHKFKNWNLKGIISPILNNTETCNAKPKRNEYWQIHTSEQDEITLQIRLFLVIFSKELLNYCTLSGCKLTIWSRGSFEFSKEPSKCWMNIDVLVQKDSFISPLQSCAVRSRLFMWMLWK